MPESIPKFTRQDFKFLADIIREWDPDHATTLALHFAARLTATNARFRRAAFLEACGLSEED